MTFEEEIFQDLVNLVFTLRPKEDRTDVSRMELIEELGNDVILPSINDKELLTILKKHKLKMPRFGPELLKEPTILKETIKILGIMETVNSWQEFKKVNEKRRAKTKSIHTERELTDFDKILKAIIRVPKPKGNNKQ